MILLGPAEWTAFVRACAEKQERESWVILSKISFDRYRFVKNLERDGCGIHYMGQEARRCFCGECGITVSRSAHSPVTYRCPNERDGLHRLNRIAATRMSYCECGFAVDDQTLMLGRTK